MKFLVVLLLTISLSGCATYQAVTSSPLLESSVRITVGRVLENNPAWVAPAYQFSEMAMTTLKGKEIIDINAIDTLFIEMIEDELLPEERAVAVDLFESIKQGVIADMRSRGITDPGEQVAYAIQVLSWINQSAAFRL